MLATLERHGLIEPNDSTVQTLANFSEALSYEAKRNNPAARAGVGMGSIGQHSPIINATQI